MSTRKLKVFDAIGPIANYTAGAALVAGFVELSGTNWTIVAAGQSSTTQRPVGVFTGSAASGALGLEVLDKGVVNLVCQVTMAAGDPVYPSSVAGRVIKSGGADSSGNLAFPGGFGVVIVGAQASGTVTFKIQGLA